MTVYLSNNYVLSEGKEIIEKSNLPKVEFYRHNLNPQLSYLSYNLINNLGDTLGELLEETKSGVNRNLKEEVVQTFMIQLIILCAVNMFLGCVCFYWLMRINKKLKYCFECYTLIKTHEIEIQNSICLHILNLLTTFKYNEKILISEFIDQQSSNRAIVMKIESQTNQNQKKRSLAELVQKSPFLSHIKISIRLMLTFTMFISYLIVSILIMLNMQSTARVAVFGIESCQSKAKLDLAFRELYYEFYTDDSQIYQFPNKATYERLLRSAQEYPKFFTDQANDWDFYFSSRKPDFEKMLSSNFCSTNLNKTNTISQKFSNHVCEYFSSQTAKEGLLAFWYYEVDTMRSIY
jgi:hypothetical protein